MVSDIQHSAECTCMQWCLLRVSTYRFRQCSGLQMVVDCTLSIQDRAQPYGHSFWRSAAACASCWEHVCPFRDEHVICRQPDGIDQRACGLTSAGWAPRCRTRPRCAAARTLASPPRLSGPGPCGADRHKSSRPCDPSLPAPILLVKFMPNASADPSE